MRLRYLILGIVIILMSGCAKLVLMKNDKTGAVEKCEVSAMSGAVTGMFASNMTIRNCVKQWEKAGYKRVE